MTTLNRAQIEAWLTLEGYELKAFRGVWCVAKDTVGEWRRYIEGDDTWELMEYELTDEDMPTPWGKMRLSQLRSLYEALTRDCSNSEEP